MQHYELLYIIPVKYTEEEAKEIHKKVVGLITARGGGITREDSLGLLRLAYPIKQVHQGYYSAVEFNLEMEKLREIERELKLMNEVLRHQIVKKIAGTEEKIKEAILKEKKEKLEEQREEQKEKKGPQVAKKEEKEKKPPKKVDIDELEKKLDKILDSDII